MSPELLAYPFLFIAIFFESFVLVTFLSAPAREARARKAADIRDPHLPRVAIVVPCLNEGETVAATIESILALRYPKDRLEVILVDNGSTDTTPEVMARYAGYPQVKVLAVTERGKHHAVNAGIMATAADLVGCLDADSFVEPDALLEIIPTFANPSVAATVAAIAVHKPDSLLRHMQNAEYTIGILLRHILASVNGLHVTPGPFSIYRREVIVSLGGFREGHQTEDLEMALRLQEAGHWIENAPRARVYTKTPATLPKLIRQRMRWTSGFLRNVGQEYRGLVFNPMHGALGMIVLPLGFLAIASGILIFCLFVFQLMSNAIVAIELRAGIPAAYAWLPHSSHLDWFYLPSNMYILLGAAAVIGSMTMLTIGKRVSRTPGSLVTGVLVFIFLYGLIAPLWLMRATADVALGKKRTWS
ncbi:MAG: glycosyltransferase family 2 protein [bacterium]|nr:glycosyltransferase family 2 protein [bacterium]